MTTEAILQSRKEGPTLDELTTLLWTREMGQRMALVRMKGLQDQKELGNRLGLTQQTISRLESGFLQVCEKLTVHRMRTYFGTSFAFILFGKNPERFNRNSILRHYWDTRLRTRRKNKALDSRICRIS